MKDKINAIKEYLKYFPNEINANNNLKMCAYLEELEIVVENSYYPRIEYNQFRINEQMMATKKYKLSNSVNKFEQNGEDTLVIWKESSGRLAFVESEYYSATDEEWEALINTLLSYNPVDYDPLNDVFVYNVEDGKRLINDYKNIIKDFKKDVQNKIDKTNHYKKVEAFNKLKEELGEEFI